MDATPHIELGVIQGKHGLKGAVVVLLHPDVPELTKLRTLFVQIGPTLVPYGIVHLTLRRCKAVMKLQGVDSPDGAQALRGNIVFIALGIRSYLARASMCPSSLLGYQVVDAQEGFLGTVQALYAPSQQQLLAIDYQGKELLIPYHKAIIKGVNRVHCCVTVQLPVGFIEASL